ncbi:MAG TPA: hypothetical protein VK689_07485, partial [Armatimonadota bacterium]|nr:hypothetical protein [Armatimonadota bacterium]
EEEAASPELRAAAATLREEAPASASKEQVQGLERLIAREPLRAKGRPAISPLREAYRKSAAVLTALDPHRLRPLGLQAEPGSALNELVEDLVEAYEPASSAERWILRPELRERVLAGMAGRAELILALAANPERPKTLLQRTLDAYIHEPEPFALESQPLDQLMASLQAVRWLKAAGIDLPDPERIQELIELNQVPAVFEKMAGRYFAGREKEMARLRDYVGVLPPSTRFEDARRQFRKWFSLRKQPPLAIHAPGGAGKTTLVSRFILDHSRVPKDSKFPYVYLDFDNPQLTLRDPGTLLAEAVRQLSAQYPQARSQLKAFLADERRTSLNEQQAGGSGVGLDRSLERQESEAAEAASRFASLIHGIVHRTEDGQEFSLPFLLVLDTYEEVQRRGLSHEIRLWDLVEAIQRKFETLRVLVAGRAHLERIPTSNTPTESMRLDEFDIESGMGFLLHLGVTDSAVAKELYRQVGGNPLSLKLAAEIYRREGTNPAGMPELRRRLLFFSANESLVQGQLYQRILSHIRNPEVRRLAHPGLVLRRITPQLIREVLQGPCGVPVENDARAQELFAAMRGEVALVSVDADGALRHRPDVRRTMLKLLERDKPEQAEEINRLAVEFYSRRRGVA